MKRAELITRIGLGIALTVGFAFAWLHLRRYPVGLFIDDARFILRSLSLLQGKYVALELPGHPPTNIPSPGFPFLLLPFVAALAPAWDALPWIALAITVGAVYFLWTVLKELETPWRVAVVSLFALNPFTGAFASALLAESAVILFTFASLEAIRAARDEPALWKDILCGLLLGWACLIRSECILLLPILLWPLVQKRQWNSLVRMGLIALGIEGLILLRNQALTRSASGYFSQWVASWRGGGVLPTLIYHWQQIADVVIGDAFLSLSGFVVFNSHPRLGATVILLALLALGLALIVVIRSRAEDDGRRLQLVCLAGALLLVHSFWLSFSPHHFWPMVPGLLILLISGLKRLSQWPALKPVALALPIILGAGYVSAQWQSLGHPSPQLPVETFAWLKTHARPDDVIFAPDAATVALRTGRPVLSAHTAGGVEVFQYHLLAHRIRWIVDRPFTPLFFPEALESTAYREGADAQARRWMEETRSGFAVTYRNEKEGARIFEVMPAPELIEAYPAFERGANALRDKNTAEGITQLKAALKIYPTFATALRTLGTAYYLENKIPQATEALDFAARLRPNDPLLRLNRARLYARTDQLDKAREEYRAALQLLSLPGEFPSIRRTAQEEADRLPPL